MAGVRLTITTNADSAEQQIRSFRVRVEDLRPLMKNIGEIALASVQENFEVGGRPKWQPLSPSTVKKKGHAIPLLQTGMLRNITLKTTETSVIVGVQPAAEKYAAIQQLGGEAGRKRSVRPGTVRGSIFGGRGSVRIPARPYMILQPEDLAEIDALANKHIAEAAK